MSDILREQINYLKQQLQEEKQDRRRIEQSKDSQLEMLLSYMSPEQQQEVKTHLTLVKDD